MEIKAHVPYAILFLCDPSNAAADTPEYNPDNIISSNDQCISIGTRSEVDGDTTIGFYVNEYPMESDGVLVFSGLLHAPSKHVCVQDALNQELMTLEVDRTELKVIIIVDHARNPGVVRIYVNS